MTSSKPAHPLFDLSGLDPRLREFAAYWSELPKDKMIPHRQDFHPEKISRLLPSISIHEYLRPDYIRLRLIGTDIEKIYDQHMTGKNYLDFIAPSGKIKTSQIIHTACTHPAGMVFHTKSTTKKGTILNRESVALPMRNNEGISCLVYYCTVTTNPDYYADQKLDRLVITDVSIHYIDIGAGIPDIQISDQMVTMSSSPK
ncbi:PAS domain-containing protein [Kiloniella antarctica]|uniref:PAS domain-containing protein n=1 Tax=Kiloniella antarctica TaxID=1550907 RepID=A0ABW5BK54_9PROT